MTTAIHEVTAEEIMAHQDGELPADRAQEVSAHLETCVECRNLADSLQSTSQSLASWVVPEAPESLQPARAAFHASFGVADEHDPPFSWASLRERRVLLTFCLAACTIFFVFFYSTGNFQHSQSETWRHAARVDINNLPQMSVARAGGGGGGGDRLRLPSAHSKAREELSENANSQSAQAPLIARTAQLQIVVTRFEAARAAVESTLARHHGYAATLNVGDAENAARTLNASLRIPSQELPAALDELKTLGHVTSEGQAGEEVTAEHADLVARLKNSRETETRLQDILRTRTGKVSDILEVEQEMARVRGEIEQMGSDLKSLNHRVDYATITLSVSEEYKAKVSDSTPGIATRFHNAAVAGLKNVRDSAVGLALSCAEFLPPLVFWLLILATPVAVFWRLRRRAIVAAASPLA
jgi:hypothetical protein